MIVWYYISIENGRYKNISDGNLRGTNLLQFPRTHEMLGYDTRRREFSFGFGPGCVGMTLCPQGALTDGCYPCSKVPDVPGAELTGPDV